MVVSGMSPPLLHAPGAVRMTHIGSVVCVCALTGDDDDHDAAAAADNINWRSYVDKNKLSDRQTKLLDKIR